MNDAARAAHADADRKNQEAIRQGFAAHEKRMQAIEGMNRHVIEQLQAMEAKLERLRERVEAATRPPSTPAYSEEQRQADVERVLAAERARRAKMTKGARVMEDSDAAPDAAPNA
jgi:predicted  nucleic acid-binding Zn-ribbon protein